MTKSGHAPYTNRCRPCLMGERQTAKSRGQGTSCRPPARTVGAQCFASAVAASSRGMIYIHVVLVCVVNNTLSRVPKRNTLQLRVERLSTPSPPRLAISCGISPSFSFFFFSLLCGAKSSVVMKHSGPLRCKDRGVSSQCQS
jgi:hypothetical protein